MSALASAGNRQTRFHGRAEARGACAHPGCDAPGEFRAPAGRGPSFDGPGDWRWLCLDHVREFNAGYNYFEGMSRVERQRAVNTALADLLRDRIHALAIKARTPSD